MTIHCNDCIDAAGFAVERLIQLGTPTDQLLSEPFQRALASGLVILIHKGKPSFFGDWTPWASVKDAIHL